MNLIKQVITDVLKEIGWVLFYGLLCTLTLRGVILAGNSFQYVLERYSLTNSYVERNVVLIMKMGLEYYTDSQNAYMPNAEGAESIDDYLTDVFSENGNAGTWFDAPSDSKYDLVIFLLGVYADLTPFSPSPTDSITFAVSHDLKDSADSEITFNETNYPLYVAPEDMYIHHPLIHATSSSGYLQNTLFIFSKDFQAANEVHRELTYSGITSDDYAMSFFIMENPSSEDIARLRTAVYNNFGLFVNVETTENFLRRTSEGGIRTSFINMMFYVVSLIVLLCAMLLSIYRILKRKTPDYATHHLFGASESFIFARMFFFVLTYHLIPLAATAYLMSGHDAVTPLSVSLSFIIVLCIVFIVTSFAHKEFKTKFAQGLRRE